MIRQLKIGTLALPKVYVCDNSYDAKTCRSKGVPYIVKPRGWDDDKLIKAVLFNTLVKRFPDIKWDEIFGSKFKYKPPVKKPIVHSLSESRSNPGYDTCGHSNDLMEVTDGYRMTYGGLDPDDVVDYGDATIDEYLGSACWNVSIEELQALKMLPTFMDDIADAVKTNIANTAWMDGYNKKLGIPTGYYQGSTDAPNLIILDTSGSIPSGVASTMVTLIETLRTQANADLIITSGRSVFFDLNEDIPTADKLSYLIGGCNECRQFYDIIKTKVLGKHWGNVIIFGDNDAPDAARFADEQENAISLFDLQSTKIDRIMAFHTYHKEIPGYGLWAQKAAPNAEVVINNEWVECMNHDRFRLW